MAYKFNPFTGNLDVTPFSLNGAGKIPSDYLPSYVDDAIEYANLAGFPGTGETGKIYVAQDTGYTYRWTGSVYVRIGSGGEVELNLGSTGSPSLFFNGDANTGLYSPGADQVAVATNGAERLRINSSGKVGIGTASPTTPLEIASSGTANAIVSAFDATASRAYFQVGGTTSGRYTQIGTNTSTTFINDYFGTGIAFQLSASEKVRIDSSGKVGIGTTSPSNLLDVASTQGEGIRIGASPAGFITRESEGLRITGASTNKNISFVTAGTEACRIDTSGRLLVGTSSNSGGARLQVNDNRIRIATAKTPASASVTGTAGEICWDANYIYVCTATNTWKRTAISTW
jgi:hypothetical protein